MYSSSVQQCSEQQYVEHVRRTNHTSHTDHHASLITQLALVSTRYIFTVRGTRYSLTRHHASVEFTADVFVFHIRRSYHFVAVYWEIAKRRYTSVIWTLRSTRKGAPGKNDKWPSLGLANSPSFLLLAEKAKQGVPSSGYVRNLSFTFSCLQFNLNSPAGTLGWQLHYDQSSTRAQPDHLSWLSCHHKKKQETPRNTHVLPWYCVSSLEPLPPRPSCYSSCYSSMLQFILQSILQLILQLILQFIRG